MEKLEESLDEQVFLLLSKTRPPKVGHEGKLVFEPLELGVRRGCQLWLLYQLALCFPKMDLLEVGWAGVLS